MSENASTEQDADSAQEAEEHFEESEPYLGPAWAVVMLVLYLLKEAFPAETYSALWWFQMYILCVVVAITLFTLIKRHQFYRDERKRQELHEERRSLR